MHNGWNTLQLAITCSLAAILVVQSSVHTLFAQKIDERQGPRSFAASDDEPIVPGFGSGQVKYRFTPREQAEAASLLRRYDLDGDGTLDRREAARGSWSRIDPFQLDLNHDERVNLLELAQREARIRLQNERATAGAFSLMAARRSLSRASSAEYVPFRRTASADESDESSRSIAGSVIARYDQDKDRSLNAWERRELGIEMSKADRNGDGLVNRDELDTWIFRQIEIRRKNLTGVLPPWFFDKDKNADGQLGLGEFSQDWNEEVLEDFTSLDSNDDGLITTSEMLQSKSVAGGVFSSQKALVLAPYSNVVSEIEIDEDFEPGALNIQLTITHTNVSLLDAHLVGPDGQEILLFAGVGKDGDHFQSTMFDDESGNLIRRGQAPFSGTYQPQAVEQGQKSLSSYRGKNLRGVWQLRISANRNDRFGLLHSWSLIAKPERQ